MKLGTWTCVLAAGALANWTGPAHAAPASPAYPKSANTAELSRWLASQTDLPLASVVLTGPGYVFAFPPPDPVAAPDGLVWKQVREEVVSRGMESRLNGRSASAVIAFDCRRNQATASNVIVYAGNSLQPQPGRSVPAADWLEANPGLYLMDLAAAACDPAFRRPLDKPPAPEKTAVPEKAAAPAIGPAPLALRGEIGDGHWVQVGAFANAAAANRKWHDIQHTLPTQSAGRGVKIEPVSAGKSLVRALVGPFQGLASAQAFCTGLKAHGGDCLVR